MTYQYPMERVLFNLHQKVVNFVLLWTTVRLRKLAENILLVLSMCGFGALLMAHLSFVYRGESTVSASRSIPLSCLRSIPGFTPSANITHLILIDGSNNGNVQDHQGSNSSSWAYTVWPSASSSFEDFTCSGKPGDESCVPNEEGRIYLSYSPVRGYLLLPTSMISMEQHNISVQFVKISKADANCFGEPFLQNLIFGLQAVEPVMINWLLALEQESRNSTSLPKKKGGYVYNPRADLLIDLHPSDSAPPSRNLLHSQQEDPPDFDTRDDSHGGIMASLFAVLGPLRNKIVIVCNTSFLYFITTTLVSFTLRETQERMLDFTHQLQARVRSRRPVARLVVRHMVDNLVFVPVMVGMIFFLIEFYRGDKVLAFNVLTIVWINEVFSVIALRSTQGLHYFPPVFFLLFSLFHFYLFSFPFGFSHTALATLACFLLHSMAFFWHRYELPAMAHRLVTIERPRMTPEYTHPRPPPPPGYTAPYNPPPAVRDGGSSIPPDVPTLHNRHGNTRNMGHGRPSTTTPPSTTTTTRGAQLTTTSSLVGMPLSRASASSLSRMSRPTSETILFRADDEDEGSYAFFMDGEVVLHQGARASNSMSNVNIGLAMGSSQSLQHAAETAIDSSTPGGQGNGERMQTLKRRSGVSRGGIPDHVLAALGEKSPISKSQETESLTSQHSSFTWLSGNAGRAPCLVSQAFEDPPETSALAMLCNAREPSSSSLARLPLDNRSLQPTQMAP